MSVKKIKKKKKRHQDDVDPAILKKIKEPKLDLDDLEEDPEDIVIDDEKPDNSDDETV